MLAQAFIEQRITELRAVLATAVVLDDGAIPRDHAGIGSVVLLRDLELGDDWELTLVNSVEADPEQDLVSTECPLGSALLGKRVGDLVVTKVPDGEIRYEIVSIRSLLN